MAEVGAGGKEWQCQLATPGERLAYLRHAGHLSDLTITFPGHNTIFQAHRWLLAMCSPVFEAMLYGPLAEGDVLALPADPPHAFEWLLDHMYRNETQLPGVDLALQVYQLAVKYQMDPLCRLCSQYLIEGVTPENFPYVYETAALLGDELLLARCGEVLAVSSDEVLASRDISILGRSSLRQLLQHEDLAASSEALVFRAVVAWGREQARMKGEGGGPSPPHQAPHVDARPQAPSSPTAGTAGGEESPTPSLSRKVKQFLPQVKLNDDRATPSSRGLAAGEVCDSRNEETPYMKSPLKGESIPLRQQQRTAGEEPTEKNLRKVLDEFLPHVRFLAMTTDEFVEHVLPCGVLTNGESAALLMNIKNVANVLLPWFAASGARDRRTNRVKTADLMFCEDHYVVNDQEILRNLRVSTTVHVSQVTAPGVTSVKDSLVKISSSLGDTVGKGRWHGIGCKFDYPVKLLAGETYSVVVEQAYGPCSGCQCQVSSEHEGIQFSGKTLGLTPVYIEYWEASTPPDSRRASLISVGAQEPDRRK